MRQLYQVNDTMGGFICSPLAKFQSENACQQATNNSYNYYSHEAVNRRFQNCANYFKTTKTVAFWPVGKLHYTQITQN